MCTISCLLLRIGPCDGTMNADFDISPLDSRHLLCHFIIYSQARSHVRIDSLPRLFRFDLYISFDMLLAS